MGVRMRKQYRMGPVHWNVTQDGLSSWSLKLGRWSWNSRTRSQRVDLPGPFHWQGRTRRQRSESSS